MPNEPKKRHSRQRQGKRRAAIHLGMPAGISCANCGMPTVPHTVCSNCGYYRGKEVIKKTTKQPQPDAAVESE